MPSSLWQNLSISQGSLADYHALHSLHYRSLRVGAPTRIFAARYAPPNEPSTLAGVLVESLPPLASTLRNFALPNRYNSIPNLSLRAAKINAEIRTLSRVIVHPAFRSLGLATALVQHALAHAQTPYVEAFAAMGRIHPFFKSAGMTEYDRPPHPAHIRLTAALTHENLTPLDLVTPNLNLNPNLNQLTPFLLRELQLFTHSKSTSPEALLTRARQSLLSQPLYYLWKNRIASTTHPQASTTTHKQTSIDT